MKLSELRKKVEGTIEYANQYDPNYEFSVPPDKMLELIGLLEKAKNTCKSGVGYEPLDGLEPRPFSEFLEALRTWEEHG